MDDLTRQIVFGLACPAALTSALLAPGLLRRPDPAGHEPWPWRVPLAVAAPVTIAFLALYGWPAATETWRTAAFAPMLGLAAALVLMAAPRWWLRLLAAVALAGALTYLVRPYTRPEPLPIRLVPLPALALLLMLMEWLAARRRGPSLAIGLAIGPAATAGLVLQSGFLKLSVPAGALAVSMALVAAYSLWRRKLSLARGTLYIAIPTAFTALFFAFLQARFGPEGTSSVPFVLVAFAPLAMWAGEIPWVRSHRPWVGALVRIGSVTALCAAAFAIALAPSRPAEVDPYSDLYRSLPAD